MSEVANIQVKINTREAEDADRIMLDLMRTSDKLYQSLNDLDRTSPFNKMQSDLKRADRALGSTKAANDNVYLSLVKTKKGYDAAAKGADKYTASSSKVEKANDALSGSFGKVAGAVGGISLVAAIKGAISMGNAFDTSMNTVQSKLLITADAMIPLREQAKELGAVTSFSASQAADGMGYLAQAGLNTQQIMAAMPSTLALASAAGMDLAKSADIATNVMGAFKLQVEDLPAITDVLALTSAKANTSVEEMAQAIKQAGPIAKGFGVDIYETSAAIGQLANNGFKGEQAGMILKNMLANLASPVGEGKKALKELGITQADVFDKTADGSLKFKGMSEMLDLLGSKSVSTTDMIRIFGREAGPGLVSLLGSSDAISTLEKDISRSGAAAEMAAIQMQGMPGVLKSAASAWEAVNIAFIEMGGATAVIVVMQGITTALRYLATDGVAFIQPYITTLGEVFNTVSTEWAFFVDDLQYGDGVFAMVRAGFEAVTSVLSGAADLIGPYAGEIATVFGVLAGSQAVWGIVAGGVGLVSAALTALKVAALTNPIVAGVAAVATAAYLIYDNWSGITEWWSGVWSGMGEVAGNVVQWWQNLTFNEKVLDIASAPVEAALYVATGFFDWWEGSTLKQHAPSFVVDGIATAKTLTGEFFTWWDGTTFDQKIADIKAGPIETAKRLAGEFTGWWNSTTLEQKAVDVKHGALNLAETAATSFIGWWNGTKLAEWIAPIDAEKTISAAKVSVSGFIEWWGSTTLIEKAVKVSTAYLNTAEALANTFISNWNASVLSELIAPINANPVTEARGKVTEFLTWWDGTKLKSWLLSIDGSSFKTQIDDITSAVNIAFNDISSGIEYALGDVKGVIDEFKQTFAVWGSWFSGETGTVMDDVTRLFDMGWTGITTLISISWDLIKGAIKTGWDAATGILTAGLRLLRGDFSGAWDALVKTTIEFGDNILSTFDNIAPKMLEAGKNIIAGMGRGLAAGGKAVIDTVMGIAGDIYNAVAGFFEIRSPSKKMLEIGGFILEGLTSGIVNGAKNAISAAKKVAGDIYESVKSFFSIKSPSRLMADLGIHIPGGLAVGIEKGTGKVKTAAQKAAAAAEGAFTKIIQGLEKQYLKITQGDEAVRRYELGMEGIVGANQDAVIAAEAHVESLKSQEKKQEEAAKAAESLAAAQDKISGQSTKLSQQYDVLTLKVQGKTEAARQLELRQQSMHEGTIIMTEAMAKELQGMEAANDALKEQAQEREKLAQAVEAANDAYNASNDTLEIARKAVGMNDQQLKALTLSYKEGYNPELAASQAANEAQTKAFHDQRSAMQGAGKAVDASVRAVELLRIEYTQGADASKLAALGDKKYSDTQAETKVTSDNLAKSLRNQITVKKELAGLNDQLADTNSQLLALAEGGLDALKASKESQSVVNKLKAKGIDLESDLAKKYIQTAEAIAKKNKYLEAEKVLQENNKTIQRIEDEIAATARGVLGLEKHNDEKEIGNKLSDLGISLESDYGKKIAESIRQIQGKNKELKVSQHLTEQSENLDWLQKEIQATAEGTESLEQYNLEKRTHEQLTRLGIDAESDLGKQISASEKQTAAMEKRLNAVQELRTPIQQFFNDAFTSGKDAFSNLKDYLKDWLKQMVVEFATNKIMVSLGVGGAGGAGGGGILGGLMGGGSGSSGGLLGGLLGGGGSGGGLLGGISSMLGMGGASGGGGLLGGISSMLGIGGGASAGGIGGMLGGLFGGAGGGLMAALGPIGMVGGAIAALSSLFGKPSGDVAFSQGMSGGLDDAYTWKGSTKGNATTTALGTVGLAAEGTYRPGRFKDFMPALEEMLGSMEVIDEMIAGSLPDSIGAIKSALEAVPALTSADTETMVVQRYQTVVTSLSDKLQHAFQGGANILGQGAEAILARLQEMAFVAQNVVPALQSMNMNLGDTSESAIASGLYISDALGGAETAMQKMGFVMREIAPAGSAASAQFVSVRNQVLEFNQSLGLSEDAYITSQAGLWDYIQKIDASGESGAKAAAAAFNVAEAMNMFADSISGIKDQFTATIEKIDLDLMTQAEKQQKYMNEAEALFNDLKAESDPGRIAEISAQINESVNSAWSNMTAEQKEANADYLKNMLEAASATAEEGMKGALSNSELMAEAIGKMQGPANTIESAADAMARAAANMPTSININVAANDGAVAAVPAFASGGNYSGGLALVGETGPELINFSSGGQVYTASETARLMQSASSRTVSFQSAPSMQGVSPDLVDSVSSAYDRLESALQRDILTRTASTDEVLAYDLAAENLSPTMAARILSLESEKTALEKVSKADAEYADAMKAANDERFKINFGDEAAALKALNESRSEWTQTQRENAALAEANNAALRDYMETEKERAEQIKSAKADYENLMQSAEYSRIEAIAGKGAADAKRAADTDARRVNEGWTVEMVSSLRAVESEIQRIESIKNSMSRITSLSGSLYGNAQADAAKATITALETRYATEQTRINELNNLARENYNEELSRYQSLKSAATDLRSFIEGWTRSNPLLTPYQQLQEIQGQYDAMLAKAQTGDVEAARDVQGLANELRTAYTDVYASSATSGNAIDEITRELSGLSGLLDGQAGNEPQQPGEIGSTLLSSLESQISAQQSILERIASEATADDRAAQAAELAAEIGNLGLAMDESVFDLMTENGIKLTDLATDFGVDLNKLDQTFAAKIAELSGVLHTDSLTLINELGSDLSELAKSFGIDVAGLQQSVTQMSGNIASSISSQTDSAALIPYLNQIKASNNTSSLKAAINNLLSSNGAALSDLKAAFGVNINRLDANTLSGLDKLADSLHIDTATLAGQLGADTDALGNLIASRITQQNSSLPNGIKSGLAPYLNAIKSSNNTSSLKKAIEGIEGYVDTLPTAIKTELSGQLSGIVGNTAGLKGAINNIDDGIISKLDAMADTLHVDSVSLADSLGVNIDQMGDLIAGRLGSLPDMPAAISAYLAPYLTAIESANDPNSLKTALAAVAGAVNGVPADISSALDSKLSAIVDSNNPASTNAAVNALQSYINSLPSSIKTALNAQLGGILFSTRDTVTAANAVQRQTQLVRDNINGLPPGIRSHLNDLLSGIVGNTNGLSSRMSTVASSVNAQTSNIAWIGQNTNATNTNAAGINSKSSGIQSGIAGLQTKISNNLFEIKDRTQRLPEMKSILDGTLWEMKTHSQRLPEIRMNLHHQNARWKDAGSANIPYFAKGTDALDKDGPIFAHAGEAIFSARQTGQLREDVHSAFLLLPQMASLISAVANDVRGPAEITMSVNVIDARDKFPPLVNQPASNDKQAEEMRMIREIMERMEKEVERLRSDSNENSQTDHAQRDEQIRQGQELLNHQKKAQQDKRMGDRKPIKVRVVN